MGAYSEPRREESVGAVAVDRPSEAGDEDDDGWIAAVATSIDGPRPASRAQWSHLDTVEQEALLALMAQLSLRAVRERQEAGGTDHDNGLDEDPS
jgi:hypothetical protein